VDQMREAKCLGLVGGLGVGATVHYYQELVKAHEARGCTPNLAIIHADVNRVLKYFADKEIAQLTAYLAQIIDRLAKAGAEVAAIPAITPHMCAAELTKIAAIPIVNLIEATVAAIHQRQLKRIALFGTRFSIESRMFGHLSEFDVVMPTPEEIDYIHQTYFQIVGAKAGSDEQNDGLSRIAQRLCDQEGVEAIVLAGTELALLFNKSNTGFPHVDCARVHLDAIVQQLCGPAPE
jgi:aspartate racemase